MSTVLATVELPHVRATVEQRITDPNGAPAVAYRLVLDSGRARLESIANPVSDSTEVDVVMRQSRATAMAVRNGELGALAALQAGLIEVSGDVRVLIAAAEALAAVDTALSKALGEDT